MCSVVAMVSVLLLIGLAGGVECGVLDLVQGSVWSMVCGAVGVVAAVASGGGGEVE